MSRVDRIEDSRVITGGTALAGSASDKHIC